MFTNLETNYNRQKRKNKMRFIFKKLKHEKNKVNKKI